MVAGLFIGVNNTLITETVMKAVPAGRSAATGESTGVERGVASAAYSFLRFGGGAVAPWLAGVLGETFNAHLPFWVGAGAVLLGAGVMVVTRPYLRHVDDAETPDDEARDEAAALTVGSDS